MRDPEIIAAAIQAIVRERPEGVTAEEFCAELRKRGAPSDLNPADLGLEPDDVVGAGPALPSVH